MYDECDTFCWDSSDACFVPIGTITFDGDIRTEQLGSKENKGVKSIKNKFDMDFTDRAGATAYKKGSFPYFIGKMLKHSPKSSIGCIPAGNKDTGVMASALSQSFSFLPTTTKPLDYLYKSNISLSIQNKSDVYTKALRIYDWHNHSDDWVPNCVMQIKAKYKLGQDSQETQMCNSQKQLIKAQGSTVYDLLSNTFLDTPNQKKTFQIDPKAPSLTAKIEYTPTRYDSLAVKEGAASRLVGIVYNAQLFADVSSLQFSNKSEYTIVPQINVADNTGNTTSLGLLTIDNMSTITASSLDSTESKFDEIESLPVEFWNRAQKPKDLGYNSTYYSARDLHGVSLTGSWVNIATGYFKPKQNTTYVFHANINDGKNYNVKYRLVIKDENARLITSTLLSTPG